MNREVIKDCLSIVGNRNARAGEWLLFGLAGELEAAREKHPVFAEGMYEALGRVGAEYGELIQSVEKGEPGERVRQEALHLLVTTVRLLNGEYESKDGIGAVHKNAESGRKQV